MSLPYCQLSILLATVRPVYPDRHLKLIFPSQATTPDIQLPRLSPQAQQSHKHNSTPMANDICTPDVPARSDPKVNCSCNSHPLLHRCPGPSPRRRDTEV
jgi:hypothetical protein